MKLQKQNLGKVSITVEQDYWDVNKDYDRLVVVERQGEYGSYLSRKPVPAGILLTNREYWIKFSSVKESIILDFNKFISNYGSKLNENTENIVTLFAKVNILNEKINSAKQAIDTLVSGNATEAIDSFNEIVNFLEGFKDSDTLAANLNSVKENIQHLHNKDITLSHQISNLESKSNRILDFDGLVDNIDDVPTNNPNAIYWVKSLSQFRCSFAPDDPTLEELQYYNDNDGFNSYYRIFRYDGFLWHIDKDVEELVHFVDENEFKDNNFNINNKIEIAKREVFNDLWEKAITYGCPENDLHHFGGYFPHREHPYVCNEIEMDYDEAVETFIASMPIFGNRYDYAYAFAGNRKLRTVFPFRVLSTGHNYGVRMRQAFWDCRNLETIDSVGHYLSPNTYPGTINIDGSVEYGGHNVFQNCSKLRKILCYIQFYKCSYQHQLTKCNSLELCRISSISENFYIADSPLWNYESVSYTVTNAANTTPITITVHPDVYAKLTNDTTNAAAAALTADELAKWGQILTNAIAKNITFATV